MAFNKFWHCEKSYVCVSKFLTAHSITQLAAHSKLGVHLGTDFINPSICFWPLGGSAARKPTSSHPEKGSFLLHPTWIQLGRSGGPLSQATVEKLLSHHGCWLWTQCCPRGLADCTGKTGSGMWPSLLVCSTGQGWTGSAKGVFVYSLARSSDRCLRSPYEVPGLGG